VVPASLLPHLRNARDLADRHYPSALDLDALVGAAHVSKLELTLTKPGPPLDEEDAATFRRMLDKGSLGAVGLATDDCRKTHEELTAKGVAFIQEPGDRPYGVEAILRDNSGNWLVLVERTPSSGRERIGTSSWLAVVSAAGSRAAELAVDRQIPTRGLQEPPYPLGS
jgi:hypothetical protein